MGSQFDTGRIEAFSDGFFSVAATLLVVELAVPAADFNDLWKGIVDQWPSYLLQPIPGRRTQLKRAARLDWEPGLPLRAGRLRAMLGAASLEL